MALSKRDRRTLLNERSASYGAADLLRFRSVRDWYADYVASGRLEDVPFPADVTILCHWCRTYHKASEVEACMALPKPVEKGSLNGSSTSSAAVGQLLKPYPEIWGFLSLTTYPDGKRRLTGRLSLSCGPSGICLSLTDEHTGQYVSMTGSTLDDVLLLVEAGLHAEDLPWRASKYPSRGKR